MQTITIRRLISLSTAASGDDGGLAEARQAYETAGKHLEGLKKEVRARMNDSATITEARVAGDQRLDVWLGVLIAILLIGSGSVLYRMLIRILGCEPAFAAKITHRIASLDLNQDIRIALCHSNVLMLAIHGK